MNSEILNSIINDFQVDTLTRFFREKNRAFAPRTEDLSQYNDDNFTNGIKLGEIQFAQDEKLLICSFESNQLLTERSGKKAQYEKGKSILKEANADAGIFIFYPNSPLKRGVGGVSSFRFSLIYPEYTGTKRQWGYFKRFTYFVSPELKNKTFLQQIGDGDFSSLQKIKEAFSVEPVTKQFYAELQSQYGLGSNRTIRGLIEILQSYNFTIGENTPVDQEIALDPELLGKVFENLLASYNPETATTARKATGSYYTPREIVDYMVGESLTAYLANAINNAPQPPLKLRGGEGEVMPPSPLAGEGNPKTPFPLVGEGEGEGGFDVVIGNPPYVRADSPAIAEQRKLIMQSNQYETLWEKWDLMVPFYEKSLKLLTHEGINAFIASNSITTSKFAYKLQDRILKNYKVKNIDYFEDDRHIFEAGVVPVVTIIMKTKQNFNPKKIYREKDFTNIASIQEVDISDSESLRERVFKKSFSDKFSPKIETEKLGDICYISYGLRPNSDERYWKGEFTRDDLISETKDTIHPKAYVEGKLIKRYAVEKIMYFEWDTDRVPKKLVRPTFPELYIHPKILSGRVTGAIYDDTGLVCNDSIVVFVRFIDLAGVNNKSISGSLKKFNTLSRKELEEKSKNYDLKYLLAILNSTYGNFYLNNHRRHRLENYFYPDEMVYKLYGLADEEIAIV